MARVGSPTSGNGNAPKATDPLRGVARSVDEFLVRVDALRDRPAFSTTLTVVFGLALSVLWWFAQGDDRPIDELIPMAGSADSPVAAVSPAPTNTGSAGGGEDHQESQDLAPMANSDRAAIAEEVDGRNVDPEFEMLIVHVSGAVVEQGLVRVPGGSRLADAIAAAGGATPEADVHRLNLAAPAVDGMHIRVPGAGSEADQGLPLVEFGPNVGSGSSAGLEPGTDDRAINVNRAGEDELQSLPGIGPATAAAIVAWRDEHGPFAAVDELLDVPGIGPAKLAAIEERVEL